MSQHIPVLAKEVIDGLALAPGMTVLDGTLGLGGHATLILAATAPDGVLIGFDRDARNIELARQRLAGDATHAYEEGNLGERVTYVNDSFGNVHLHGVPRLDGALLDLGFSSVHVDDPARGFSFMADGPLDMRYDTRQDLTAEAIVNGWSRDDLASIFRAYGEEPYASGIAKSITEARKRERITTTGQLAALISSLAGRRGKIHPATRVFQALRIAVNDELGELERGLEGIAEKLAPGARFAVITFHSLEDRIVKQFFQKGIGGLAALTKKPIVATREEIAANPRARSAKLRIAEKR